MSSVDFSSWPREQEASFVVFEEHMKQSSSKALTAAAIASAVVLLLSLGMYFGVEPDRRDITKDMNMSNLGKKGAKAPTPSEQK